jgi:hypothetical protein
MKEVENGSDVKRVRAASGEEMLEKYKVCDPLRQMFTEIFYSPPEWTC